MNPVPAGHGPPAGDRMERQRREEMQREIEEVASELDALARRLAAMAASIPEPEEAVLEGQAPWTLEAEMKGTLEIVVNDDLLPASKVLAELALATPDIVRERWEQAQRPEEPR